MGVLAVVLGVLSPPAWSRCGWSWSSPSSYRLPSTRSEMPVRQAFAVEMVGREDIMNAVALNSATFNGARIVGPAVAGLAIAAFDISIAFLINGASYVAVVVALFLMRDEEMHLRPSIPRRVDEGRLHQRSGRGCRTSGRRRFVLLPVSWSA